MSGPCPGADLLRTARDLLRGEVAPALPGPLRYPAAMIANAVAIAARELEEGPACRAELRTLYATFYPDAPPSAPLERLERRLADDIRAGRLDEAPDGPLSGFVLARTRLRLRVSSPELLRHAEPCSMNDPRAGERP